MKKWALYLLIAVLVVIAIGAFWVIRTARGGLPDYTGTIAAGVEMPVEIYRDEYGIPHIIASSMEDLYFAQGYAQAQDRLWQMDMNRRGVGGKLSVILGEDFVEIDTFTLTIGFMRAAEKNYNLLAPEGVRLLEAYAAGVNTYIEDNWNNLPPEFTLIGYKPEPWEPLHSLGIGVYMSWYLGGNMDSELIHSAMAMKVGLPLTMEIFPDYPDYGPVIAPASPFEDEEVARLEADKMIRLAQLAELGGKTRYVPGLGSNNWVISGDLTESGGAILANDMHLGMGLPSIWHSAHLILEDEFNITGVMFPGIPGIIAGFNEHIAWGLTNTGPDVQDLYQLELNPENPQQYLYMGQWRDADVHLETFQVKGEPEPRELEVVETHFGPVISDIVDLEIPLSLRWTALDGTRELEAVTRLMHAENWEQFTAALEYFMAPTQNFVYADKEGNIGYRANGLIPIRNSGMGLIPADGTTDEYEWTGYIPWAELPTLYNPPEGIIITANHRVVADDYPYFITTQWAPPYRAKGIAQELDIAGPYTLDDMITAQTSFLNTQAKTLKPAILAALARADLDAAETEALSYFSDWLENPVESKDEIGPSIYNTLYKYMLRFTFAEKMEEELYERFLYNRASINAFDRMLLSGESGWFEGAGGGEAGRDAVIAEAFKASVAFLTDQLGSDPGNWAWGNLHTITFNHDLGSIDLLARFYNRGPHPVGGSFHTPANMSYQMTDPFGVTHSAPWRYMIDLKEHRALEALAIGNSGHFLSKHYDDQLDIWLAGEYKPMIFEVEEVRELEQKLILEPR